MRIEGWNNRIIKVDGERDRKKKSESKLNREGIYRIGNERKDEWEEEGRDNGKY